MTVQDFADLGLAGPLVGALRRAGFHTPTPIQVRTIPPQLRGRDVIGLAQTGGGKTAAFALPILHHLLARGATLEPRACHALILAPTRELALQTEANLRQFAAGTGLSVLAILGGVSRKAQIRHLVEGAHVVVATPGRLLDLVQSGALRLDAARHVVIDEADRMLDVGFARPVRRIVSLLPEERRSAMFTATMSPQVERLARNLLLRPARISVTPDPPASGDFRHFAERAEPEEKRTRLAAMLRDPALKKVIVFARTRRRAEQIAQNLGQDGVRAVAIHGEKGQYARMRALGLFASGSARVLVATDIVARGIDVVGVSHVINFDPPADPDAYVHRAGRSGRNGAAGEAITLCSAEEMRRMRAVERRIGVRLLGRR